MKLVITESQYNRVFNKSKTKLVITESQYNRLLLEQNMSNTISKIEQGDAIKLVDSSDNELFFKVLDSFSGHILMVNCNDGVYKNSYFFITSNDLRGNNLSSKYKHKKNIKDDTSVASIKSDVSKKGKKYTFKNLKDFKVFEGAGNDLSCNLSPSTLTPKFDVDLDSGKIQEPKEEEKDDNTNDKESMVNEIVRDLLSLKMNETYIFELDDGSELDMSVNSKGGDTISFEVVEVSGAEGERYKNMIEDVLEFKGDSKNININFGETKDDKTGESDTTIKSIDIKFKRYLGGAEDDKDMQSKSEDFIIHGVVDFSSPSKSRDEDNSFEGLSDDEIEEYFKKFISDSSIIRNALWKKPNMFLELVGVAKERGILPAEERLGKWVRTAENNSRILKEFKTGSEKLIEFTQFKLTNRDFKKLPMVENKKYKSKVRKRGKDDVYPTLGTNFTDSKDENFFKFSIDIKEELEDRDEFKIYRVVLKYRESVDKNFKEIGEGKIKIDKVKEEEKS